MFIGTDPRQSDYPPSKAYIRRFRDDLRDALTIIPPSPQVKFVDSAEHARDWVQRILDFGSGLVYTTGGWEGSFAHIQIVKWIESNAPKVPILLGLEQPSYITGHKFRDPITTLEERIAAWLHLAPPGSRIFILPEHVADYDDLAREVGVYKRPGVYHLADTHDAPDISRARRNRCYFHKHLLELHFGMLHTSDYE